MKNVSTQQTTNKCGVSRDIQKIVKVCAQMPTKYPEHTARMALQKLAAESYRQIDSELRSPYKSKMLFVSLFATVLLGEIQNRSARDAAEPDYLLISHEVFRDFLGASDHTALFHTFKYLIPAFKAFVSQYSMYVDDILSWAYQYVSKLSCDSGLEKTQFFTEKYMIEYLTAGVSANISENHRYLDPACGGGNFLSYILDKLYRLGCTSANNVEECIDRILSVLYGYELDARLAVVASANLKLKALSLLSENRTIQAADWELFRPNVFTSVTEGGFGFLEADFHKHLVYRIGDKQQKNLCELTERVAEIYTNPPFQTVKGMPAALKEHLKTYFPESKCDLCNAFILQCFAKAPAGGTVGLVTQSSWMYLDSFEQLRRRIIPSISIMSLADLGPGAFYDLSGEKANVTLLTARTIPGAGNGVKMLTLRDLPLEEKIKNLLGEADAGITVDQMQLFSGEKQAFSPVDALPPAAQGVFGKYGDYGTPMQGTSTGSAAQLIAYYWEHLNDPEWVPVSKGGGYSRWCGLNSYVLKWGHNGEYIRAVPGSALRNTKYFDRTALVYSDTGTSGFNARLLERGQLFVASGPGIRDLVGSPFAHLALLNSRVFSYYLRRMSPKLTVAAGYIARVPVPQKLLDMPELEVLGGKCYQTKRNFIKMRPNNLEWARPEVHVDSIRDYAVGLFCEEMGSELDKLVWEAEADRMILDGYSFRCEETERLDVALGCPAAGLWGAADPACIDSLISQNLNANAQLARTKARGRLLGCDGILEYVSYVGHVDPRKVVDMLKSEPGAFVRSIDQYEDLCIHNIVLGTLGFREAVDPPLRIHDVSGSFCERYPALKHEWRIVEGWIREKFNVVHIRSFCNRPYYRYEDGRFRILY